MPKSVEPAPTMASLLHLLIPVLMLTSLTALLAGMAVLIGWLPQAMIVINVIAAALALLEIVALAFLAAKVRGAARGAISDAQMRLGSIVESTMDGIIAVDEEQKIVLFNSAAEEIFGWSHTQVLGKPLDMLLPERFRRDHAKHIRHFGSTGVTNRRMGSQTVLAGLRASGQEFPMEASISQQVQGEKKIFTAILRDITERISAEKALKDSHQELRELGVASRAAREQEKGRVARELHDEIGGSLTALKMDTAWLREYLPANDTAMAEKIQDMEQIIDKTVAATRRMSSNLRPIMLDDLGLIPAIEWQVQDFQKHAGIPCELAVGTDELLLSDDRATAVFRLLQESLTNITKHARAGKVEVNLEIVGGDVVLTVHDDGCGFDLAGSRPRHSFGLVGMRERVDLLGGSIHIESSPGKGTVIEAHVPIKGKEDAP